MSFGYSFGDFVAGANLSYRLIRALSETCGANIEYQEAISELASIQHTFLQVGSIRANSNLDQATINAASHIVLSSVEIIGEFLEKTKTYRARFGENGRGSRISESWRKMGWVLFQTGELRELKNTLHLKLTNIGILLSAAKFHGCIPSAVELEQYHVDTYPEHESSSPSQDRDYPSVGGSPKKVLEIDLPRKRLTSSVQTRKPPPSGTQGATEPPVIPMRARSTRQSSLAATGEDHDKDSDSEPDEVPTPKSPEETKTGTRATNEDPEDYALHSDNSTLVLSFEEKGNKSPFPSPEKIKAVDVDAAAANDSKNVDDDAQRDMVEGYSPRASPSAMESNLISQIQDIIHKNWQGPQLQKKPIKFKDAVGRKFSFPFHLCQTWAGMEELIRQAFLHVEVIGPHVAEGHYDLVGSTGEIILPQVWETVVEPGWAVSMHMWPLPEAEKRLQNHNKIVEVIPPSDGVYRPNSQPTPRRGPPPPRPDEIIVIEEDTPKKPSKKGVLRGIFNRNQDHDSDSDSDSSCGSYRTRPGLLSRARNLRLFDKTKV